MKKETIDYLVKTKILRVRQIDLEKIKSMINSAEINAKVAKSVPLDEESATLVFREVYESIRQLGDANWWALGYEPANHEVSMEILREIDIKERLQLNFLERFKQIRHDANYRAFRASISQAKEIISFWDKCSKEIIEVIMRKIGKRK